MATWLTWQEKVNCFAWYLRWAVPGYDGFEREGDEGEGEEEEEEEENQEEEEEEEEKRTTYMIAKKPSFPLTSISTITKQYGACDFLLQLSEFLTTQRTIYPSPVHLINDGLLVPVYRQVVLQLPYIRELGSESRRDTVHATPAIEMTITDKGMKESIPSRFSTVVVKTAEPDDRKGPIHGECGQ